MIARSPKASSGPCRRPRNAFRQRLVALALLLAAVGGLTGCGSDEPPQVTYTAAGVQASTGPAQYCDVEVSDCEADPAAAAVLRVPPGTPLEVSVPEPVASTPWQVVFRYRPAGAPTGTATEGRSEVFAAGERADFTLGLPPGTQLETAEVQQFGVPARDPRGGVQFLVRGTWVLSVDDR